MAEYFDPNNGRANGQEESGDSPALPEFLKDPRGVLSRRWPWMLAAVLVGFVATGAAVYWIRPVFLAEASILITSQQIPEEFVRSTVRDDTISNINAMVGGVLSRENLARLIEDFDLAPGKDEQQVSAMIGAVRSRIEVVPRQAISRGRRGESSMIYAIDFRSEDPVEAATVANALAGLFAEASIERRSAQARRTTDFLKRQLDRDEAELREQSQSGSAFRRAHRGELPSELDTNMRRLEMLSERRSMLATQIASKENRILTMQAAPPAAVKSESEILLDSLRRQLATESAANTEEHPNVIAIRERIARLEEVVAGEGTGGRSNEIVAAENREVALLKSQRAETEAAIDQLNDRLDHTPAIAEQLGAIEEKEKVLRERYLASLRKVEDSQLAESLESAQQGAQVSILDRASVPSRPEIPRWLTAVAGVAGSVVLALALGVLLEIVDPVIVNIQQLERLADGRCLGSLPHVA